MRCPVCGNLYYLTTCDCQTGRGMPRGSRETLARMQERLDRGLPVDQAEVLRQLRKTVG